MVYGSGTGVFRIDQNAGPSRLSDTMCRILYKKQGKWEKGKWLQLGESDENNLEKNTKNA